eukprot:CAMPEP_0197318342 /NCGR_PEP_ID=MMETSP0891-20130614/50613_1 /TAXON_ID=44058 ORGANISM="Aureoumbra lagunensis, Strain CCMP1510" /NCGR_SAMPLE_ID=MMETSP0891 /ASSEMBLY_ACC=CAM_ASM_000534 /LENGTH=242 /DNA_ID=CAMNT_0042808745 /DNA_START=801 /DNA_END=1525 /DNA_ORIENTATION=-
MPIFWMLYDQQASVWVIQATKMKRHHIQPEQIGIANPIFILILLPLFEKYIFPYLQHELHLNPTPALRIKCGMAFASAAFFVAAFVDAHAEKLHILWQLPQIFLISIAEILVSVTGLETSYAWAPATLKSTITSAFLLTTAVGDAAAGVFFATLSLSRTKLLFLCALIMLITLFLFSTLLSPSFDNPSVQTDPDLLSTAQRDNPTLISPAGNIELVRDSLKHHHPTTTTNLSSTSSSSAAAL